MRQNRPPALILTCLLSVSTACAQRKLPTIDGPESPELAKAVRGYLVVDRPVGGIVAYELPGAAQKVVRPTTDGGATIPMVAGPDREGRVVFIENWMSKKEHALKSIRIDGSGEEEIWRRPGVANFGRALGHHLALAPAGGLAAFVGPHAGKQLHEPKAYFPVGTLEIWDIEKRVRVRSVPDVLDWGGFSWFPDGKRIAIVKFAPRPAAETLSDTGAALVKTFGKWTEVPTIFIYNVEGDEIAPLHAGWFPTVAEDGKRVLIHDDGDGGHGYYQVAADTGNIKPVSWPGGCGWGQIALLENDLVIYWGLPTTGTEPRFTENNSPLVGPKPERSIKIGELDGSRFLTLINYIDPRQSISFGRVDSK